MAGPNINLAELFKSDPMAANIGQRFLGQESQRNDADLASVLSSTNRQNALLPGELARQDMDNQTAKARLPGITANSSLEEDKATLSRKTMEQQLDELIKGHTAKDTARHLKELQDANTAYGQVAPQLQTVPGPARHAVAKQLLGPMYRPDMDQMDPDTLVKNLAGMSERAGQAATKYQLAIAQAQAKNNTQLEVQRLKNEGMMGVQRLKNQLKETTQKVVASKSVKSMSELAARYREMAFSEEDDGRKAALLEESMKLSDFVNQQRIAERVAGSAGKVDAGAATGLQTIPTPTPPPTPSMGGGVKPPQGTAENPIILK